VEQCIAAIKDCASRRLKLNDGKTEVILLGTRPRLQHLAGVDLNLSVGSDIIRPSTVVRDLGVFVDAELTFREHVRRVTSSCFFQQRCLRHIRKHVRRQVMKQLVLAFVISRLDYCNSILAGLPKGLISQLQRVQNSAARLVLGLQPRDHIKPALFELHWLPIHMRIQYKLCLLMYSVSVQCCPSYISDIVQTTAASSRRQGLRFSTDTFSYTVPPTVTKFGERAFSVAGPSVWNSLPADIRHITESK